MTALRKLALTAACATLAAAVFTYVHVADQEAQSFARFFERAAHSLKIDAAGAHFHTRHFGPKFAMGNADQQPPNGWQFEFTLTQPGERFYSPEHHSTREFIVKRITADSIVLGYKQSAMSWLGIPMSRSGECTLHAFDHGTNFETEDTETMTEPTRLEH